MSPREPYIVVEWNDTESSARGWLCVYNFVGHYCGGGTRMHPSVTRDEVVRLATTMGYKYKACGSVTTGGCKGGIAYDSHSPDALDVLRRYLVAMAPYIRAGVSIGGDLGVDYADVLRVLAEIGIGLPQTRAMREDEMLQRGVRNHDAACAMRYDGFLMYDMITGYGCAFAADEAWRFRHGSGGATVVIQGFGCVGASCAKAMQKLGYTVVGIADANRMVYCPDGLDVERLLAAKKPKGEMDPASFLPAYQVMPNTAWLDVPCDILIPAALEDVISKSNASRVSARLIVEAANIPTTAEADGILKEMGVDVVVDFIANMGGIRIYEALIFCGVAPIPEAIVADTEQIIRRNTHKLMAESARQGRYMRDIAREMFAPDTFDTPDIG